MRKFSFRRASSERTLTQDIGVKMYFVETDKKIVALIDFGIDEGNTFFCKKVLENMPVIWFIELPWDQAKVVLKVSKNISLSLVREIYQQKSGKKRNL